MKIIVASQNPVKINCTLSGFQKIFPKQKFEIEGVKVPSEVADQPMSDKETFDGAMNRVNNAQKQFPPQSGADYYVGIEAGIVEENSEMNTFAWVIIKSGKTVGKGKTGTFYLPTKMANLVKTGKELGEANNIIFNKKNSKHEGGTVGTLTHNVLNRTTYYTDAVVLALIPFINKDLY